MVPARAKEHRQRSLLRAIIMNILYRSQHTFFIFGFAGLGNTAGNAFNEAGGRTYTPHIQLAFRGDGRQCAILLG
jgi:hypothetical protein